MLVVADIAGDVVLWGVTANEGMKGQLAAHSDLLLVVVGVVVLGVVGAAAVCAAFGVVVSRLALGVVQTNGVVELTFGVVVVVVVVGVGVVLVVASLVLCTARDRPYRCQIGLALCGLAVGLAGMMVLWLFAVLSLGGVVVLLVSLSWIGVAIAVVVIDVVLVVCVFVTRK